MLHTKIRGNRPTSSGEEDFKNVFTIYGSHLGHVTSIMSSDFHFLVPESFHTKFGSDRPSNFCENHFFMYTTLGQGQEMTLIFNTHISSYIQLDLCYYYYLLGHWLQ